MPSSDHFNINLSLVSHTNIGKTTLARTLLMQDVGEVADRAHVTEDTDAHVLARDPSGCELLLWDTPGFGNSVALAKRLSQRNNPIGWFLSEVWDRFTNKSFWLDQKAIAHIRDTSDVLLYLVNSTELPSPENYIPSEMQILTWINKPVIVLLNQMGQPHPPEEEAQHLKAWKDALIDYPFVREVLPMDAFARCWVQEVALFEAIGKALPDELQSAFSTLQDTWIRGRRALYTKSIDAMAQHMVNLINSHELAPTPSWKDHIFAFATQLGLSKSGNAALEAAQSALAANAADRLCLLTQRLIRINHLKEGQTNREILRRMKSDWEMVSTGINPGSAAAIGAGVGIAGGAAAGAAVDASTGGLSLGIGTLVGGLLGALGGAGAAAIYNANHQKEGIDITWSVEALQGFFLETLLLYMAVAHFGRGRGKWQQSESPAFWKDALIEAIAQNPPDWKALRKSEPDASTGELTRLIDAALRIVFDQLYAKHP